MRTKGKITHWNQEKGYGFITPSAGAKQVFVHISAFHGRAIQPEVNQLVEFSLSTDRQGRPCAVQVSKVGARMPAQSKRKGRLSYKLGAAAFLGIVVITVLFGAIPIEILFVYLFASLLTYLVYYFDKTAAQKGSWRTQESTLHALSLFGGWPGALIAQETLRHKSRKATFRFGFWLTVILNCGLFVWLCTPSGGEMLNSILTRL